MADSTFIPFGDTQNRKQGKFTVPAGPSSGTPGVINLQSTDGATVTDRKLFFGSTGSLRVTTGTSYGDSDGSAIVASGGATPALDNLAAVAINTALLPVSTVGAIDLGSATKAFRTAYLGTSAVFQGTTRNLSLTASEPAGSSRTVNFGDPGGADSIAYLAAAQTLTTKTIDCDSNTVTHVPAANLKIAAQAQGDILYANSATTWTRLGAGTAGQFLKTQGAGANPIWDVSPTAAIANGLNSPFTIEGGTYDPSTTITTQTVSAAALTIPDLAGVAQQWVFTKLAQTLTNKTIGDATDTTKALAFSLSGATTGKTTTLTFANTLDRAVTFPDAAGTVTLLGNASTGSGSVVLATTPTLVTPILGVATATSINKVAFTAPATASTLVIADGKTLTANNSITIAGTDAKTLTVSNSLTLAGADAKTINFGSNSITLTTAGDASITVPTTGTLATLAGSETLAGKTLTTPIVNGAKVAVNAKSGTYTATTADIYIPATGGAGGFTITLPAATGTGLVLVIKKVDAGAGAITISRAGADTIEGSNTISLSAQYSSRTIIDGESGKWHILATT